MSRCWCGRKGGHHRFMLVATFVGGWRVSDVGAELLLRLIGLETIAFLCTSTTGFFFAGFTDLFLLIAFFPHSSSHITQLPFVASGLSSRCDVSVQHCCRLPFHSLFFFGFDYLFQHVDALVCPLLPCPVCFILHPCTSGCSICTTSF